MRPSDLDRLEYGMVLDIFTEMANNTAEWHQLATQEDFDRF